MLATRDVLAVFLSRALFANPSAPATFETFTIDHSEQIVSMSRLLENDHARVDKEAS